MASETSELTFVRCQTCRSLVPASASRCRICNAALEAGGKAAASDGSSSGGRVRQKTVSASPAEVANMVSQSAPAEAPKASAAAPASAGGAPFGDSEDQFDPLGAYLQDLDAEPERQEAPKVAAEQPKDLRFDDQDDDDDDDEDFDFDPFDREDDFDTQEKAEVPAEAPPREVAPPREPPARQEPPPRPAPPPSRPEPPARAPQPQSPKQQALPPRDERPAPREAAQPPRNNPGGFRAKMGGAPAPQRPEQKAAQPRQERPAAPPAKQQSQDRDQSRNKPQMSGKSDPAGGQRQQHSHNAPRAEARAERVAEPRDDRNPSPSKQSAAPRPGKVHPGRLAGWLVSYENPDGRAIELRSGRFFVTDTPIRGSDLIIEDQSISTPHALLSITDRGLMIQDLMSERGTFIRSEGDAQYRREDGIIEVRHGDWIRFGDVEFLVTLVPAGRH